MGNSSSTEIPGGATSGYHVLRVQNDSPADRAGLESYFDYLLKINDVCLDNPSIKVADILQENQNKEVTLTVYSTKTKSCRDVRVLLAPFTGLGVLGASIRFCSFEGASETVWHVLEVEPRSPAALAGLKSFTDYIIGTDSILHNCEEFFELIEDGKPLNLFVYNTETDSSREVVLTPNSEWGGEGSIGCGIGYGYLHRIPVNREEVTEEAKASATSEPPSYDESLTKKPVYPTDEAKPLPPKMLEEVTGPHVSSPPQPPMPPSIPPAAFSPPIQPAAPPPAPQPTTTMQLQQPLVSLSTETLPTSSGPNQYNGQFNGAYAQPPNFYAVNSSMTNVALPGMPPLSVPMPVPMNAPRPAMYAPSMMPPAQALGDPSAKPANLPETCHQGPSMPMPMPQWQNMMPPMHPMPMPLGGGPPMPPYSHTPQIPHYPYQPGQAQTSMPQQ